MGEGSLILSEIACHLKLRACAFLPSALLASNFVFKRTLSLGFLILLFLFSHYLRNWIKRCHYPLNACLNTVHKPQGQAGPVDALEPERRGRGVRTFQDPSKSPWQRSRHTPLSTTRTTDRYSPPPSPLAPLFLLYNIISGWV